MLKNRHLQADNLKAYLRKEAHKEGAEAARGGRARSSNPYPMGQNTMPRLEWFRGYDRQLDELTRNR